VAAAETPTKRGRAQGAHVRPYGTALGRRDPARGRGDAGTLPGATNPDRPRTRTCTRKPAGNQAHPGPANTRPATTSASSGKNTVQAAEMRSSL
jgi:hypothetical protein